MSKYILKCGDDEIIGIRDYYELIAEILKCIDEKLATRENIEITVYKIELTTRSC